MPSEIPVVTASLLLASSLRMIGQSPALDPTIGSLISNLGIIGVLIWFLYYHTTHSYPQMLDRFSTELDKLRKTFEDDQSKQRDAFLVEQAAQRLFASTETKELRTMLIQNLQAMRSAVHDVKDVAQETVNKARAALEQNHLGEKP